MYATADDVAKLGTILGIWAHPDDETWCSGALMTLAAANGQRVVCITASYGEAGETADESQWPQVRLGEIRRHEMVASMRILGITEHSWLGYPDGKLAIVDQTQAVSRLARAISRYQPDTIVTFGPDGLTGHPDHQQVYRWSLAARQALASPAQILCATESAEKYALAGEQCDDEWNIYLTVGQPYTKPEAAMDLCLKLDGELLDLKCRALQAQASQYAHMFKDESGRRAVRAIIGSECFVRA